mgnify:CR=1 FL=1
MMTGAGIVPFTLLCNMLSNKNCECSVAAGLSSAEKGIK